MAESYVVLARKYRSALFSDIVGQTGVVRTLMNAIRAERIHQAYLFTGSRGIGKTSIARIFAKALRCPNLKDQGEWLESCNTCPSCIEIAAGTSVDVLEIDGASNNGVDAVREIRDNARFMPASGSRKIYIIDEVHMLTTAAFNALLKTLEEPPPHVIFIFATTEPHKIPATILSRVQRFDFKRMTSAQVQERLFHIAKAESLTLEPGAAALIARASEGSMRDALSLLDQVIVYSGNPIRTEAARESIGWIGGAAITACIEAIYKRETLGALKVAGEVYLAGHDLKVLLRGLLEFTYGTLLAKIGSDRPLALEISEEEWTDLKRISELRPIEEIELLFQVMHQGLESLGRSAQPKLLLDVLLIKCCEAQALVQIGSPQAGSGSERSDAPHSSGSAPVGGQSPVRLAPAPSLRAAVAPVANTSATATPSASIGSVSVSSVSTVPKEKSYTGMIEFVRAKRPILAGLLEHAEGRLPESGSSDPAITLRFRQEEAYFKDQIAAKSYFDQLMALAAEYLGSRARIELEVANDVKSVAHNREELKTARMNAAKTAVRNHPVINEAKSIFGADIGPIEFTADGSEDGERG